MNFSRKIKCARSIKMSTYHETICVHSLPACALSISLPCHRYTMDTELLNYEPVWPLDLSAFSLVALLFSQTYSLFLLLYILLLCKSLTVILYVCAPMRCLGLRFLLAVYKYKYYYTSTHIHREATNEAVTQPGGVNKGLWPSSQRGMTKELNSTFLKRDP